MNASPEPPLVVRKTAIALILARSTLTSIQAEARHWIAEGKTNNETATLLTCSFFTMKTHLREIFQRLGVSSHTGAAACAYRAHIAEGEALYAASAQVHGTQLPCP